MRDTLPAQQQHLIISCLLAYTGEADWPLADTWSEIIKTAECDAEFRAACLSMTGDDRLPSLARLQSICRSVKARIAAEEAINLLA